MITAFLTIQKRKLQFTKRQLRRLMGASLWLAVNQSYKTTQFGYNQLSNQRSLVWKIYNETCKRGRRLHKRMRQKIARSYYYTRSRAWKIFNQGRKRAKAIASRLFNSIPGVRWTKRALYRAIMAAGENRLSNRVHPAIPATARQILVFGDMGLGNFLMFTPALATLRQRYPDAEIVVMFFKSRGAEIMAAGNPDIDRIVTIDMPKRSGFLPLLRLILACRRERITPDIILSRWNGSPYVSLLTMYLNPPTRVGHVSSAGFKGYWDAVFNFPIAMTEEAHEVERNLDLLRALGAEPATLQMRMPISPTHRDEAAAAIAQNGFEAKRLICLQSGSSALQSWKRWPEEKWAALATMLMQDGYELAFIGSRDEAPIAEAIMARMPAAARAVAGNFCGKLSVNGTAAFLELARGIVCNDSGLMHVAAAVGTPIVGLFGPTEYDRTRPFVDNCVILRNPCGCNKGTLFDRKTLSRIEACDRPCLNGTDAATVRRHVLDFMTLDDAARHAEAAG